MSERRATRCESLRLLSLPLSAQFDGGAWPTLVEMTFPTSTGGRVLQRHVDVCTTDRGSMFIPLNGAPLTDSADQLLDGTTQVMAVLSELRSVGCGVAAAGAADV